MSELGQFDEIWGLLVTVRGPRAPHVMFCGWVAGQCPGFQEVGIFWFLVHLPLPIAPLGDPVPCQEVLRSVWWQTLNSDQVRAVSRVLAPSQLFPRKKTDTNVL